MLWQSTTRRQETQKATYWSEPGVERHADGANYDHNGVFPPSADDDYADVHQPDRGATLAPAQRDSVTYSGDVNPYGTLTNLRTKTEKASVPPPQTVNGYPCAFIPEDLLKERLKTLNKRK